jgi:hypothetical protein
MEKGRFVDVRQRPVMLSLGKIPLFVRHDNLPIDYHFQPFGSSSDKLRENLPAFRTGGDFQLNTTQGSRPKC